eukprot:CAMPEP_0194448612 /NCGR_PEP_ID=MMETSP0176-20130528/129675_1 /TAXON_ID=216777 /ORGANISM="Proboscia alata, Strain PI-D3" /LENGTH=487 /DNA_ID=CAMNT_0039275623 /DNA_START=54 /DNA_END=1518 /DNA_ORIENTATION=-
MLTYTRHVFLAVLIHSLLSASAFTIQHSNVVTTRTTTILHAKRNTNEEATRSLTNHAKPNTDGEEADRLMDELDQTFFSEPILTPETDEDQPIEPIEPMDDYSDFDVFSEPTTETDVDEDQPEIEPMDDYSDFRCGFIGIVGAPNMGKSTLLNNILATNLCAITKRPQTTRHSILGIYTDPLQRCQLCFYDTPGVIDTPSYELQEGMMEAVKGALVNSDVLLVVTDLFGSVIPDDAVYQGIKASKKPVVVVINKIDLADKVRIPEEGDEQAMMDEERGKTYSVEEAVQKWRMLLPEAVAILPLAAKHTQELNPGIEALKALLTGGPDVPLSFRNLGRPIDGMFPDTQHTIPNAIAKGLIPAGPPLYETDWLTDRSERFFASELIRESLFERLGKEVPYCCEVRIDTFREPREGEKVIKIAASVLVERDSQKGILVGKGGSKIKQIGVDSRIKLEAFLEHRVHLDLSVKVEKDWRRNTDKLKEYGYLK